MNTVFMDAENSKLFYPNRLYVDKASEEKRNICNCK